MIEADSAWIVSEAVLPFPSVTVTEHGPAAPTELMLTLAVYGIVTGTNDGIGFGDSVTVG